MWHARVRCLGLNQKVDLKKSRRQRSANQRHATKIPHRIQKGKIDVFIEIFRGISEPRDCCHYVIAECCSVAESEDKIVSSYVRPKKQPRF